MGADINAVLPKKELHIIYPYPPALILACTNSNIDMVKLLFEYNPIIDIRCYSYKNTPLFYATKLLKIDMVKFLLSKGANPNYRNTFNNTALMEMVITQTQEKLEKKIIKIFIQHGFNINIKNKDGQTLLMKHAQYESTDLEERSMIKYLLRLGADKEIKDDYGSTACMIARVYKDKKAIRVLDCE